MLVLRLVQRPRSEVRAFWRCRTIITGVTPPLAVSSSWPRRAQITTAVKSPLDARPGIASLRTVHPWALAARQPPRFVHCASRSPRAKASDAIMNAQTRAAQGSHNTARLFPNPKISLNAREIRRLRGLVPPPPPPIPADWAPIDAHNDRVATAKKTKKPYRYKRPKNLDEKGKYVLQETINCGAVRPISSVRFTPSGRHLALGSADAIGRFCQRKRQVGGRTLFDEHEEGTI